MTLKGMITIEVHDDGKGLHIDTTIEGKLSANDLMRIAVSFANSVYHLLQDMGAASGSRHVSKLKRAD